jgi:hypothetical protein
MSSEYDARADALLRVARLVDAELGCGWPFYNQREAERDGIIDPENKEPTIEGVELDRALACLVTSLYAEAEHAQKNRALCVVVESPYRGDDGLLLLENIEYAEACVADCLRRGEAPFASHLLYTRALNDEVPHEREQGIALGLALGARLDRTVVYTDRGISPGMREGIAAAEALGRPVEYRTLPPKAE